MQYCKMLLAATTLFLSVQTSAAIVSEITKDTPIAATQLKEIVSPTSQKDGSTKQLASSSPLLSRPLVKHKRYQQMYNGLPVYGYHIISHESARKEITYTGMMVSDLAGDLASKRATTLNAQPTLELKKKEYLSRHPQALIQELPQGKETVIFIDDKNIAHEGYHVSFLASYPNRLPERPNWIIDATTGDELKAWNALTTTTMPDLNYSNRGTAPGGNEKTGFYQYGTNHLPFLTFAYEFGYFEDPRPFCSLKNTIIKVNDFKNSNGEKSSTPTWACDTNKPFYEGDSANGAASPNSDALAFGTFVMKEYSNLGLSPILSPKLIMNTHVNKDFDNAYWDGFTVNFGDGNKETYPFVTIDIVSHEIAHAFTENNAGLNYYGQSGGLNESFSDIMGKYLELKFNQQYFPDRPISWSIGEDLFKTPGKVMRYMDKPSKDGNSIDSAKDYSDSLDVHESSGVFNRLFYLIATDPRMKTSNSDTSHSSWKGTALSNSAELFLYTNMNYWYPAADFTHAALGLMQAADDFEMSTANEDKIPYKKVVFEALQKVDIYCNSNSCFIPFNM